MRATICLVLLVLLMGLLTTGQASADAGPAVTVSKTTGLIRGTPVDVSGTGLPAHVRVDVVQCDSITTDDWGGLLQDCPSLATVTSSATGTVTTTVSVVELTSRQDFSDVVPVDCRDDACRMFLVWQDVDDPDYKAFVQSPTLDFSTTEPSVTVTPSDNLAEVQQVTVTGSLDGAAGRTIKVFEQGCFAIIQASGCLGALPAESGKVRADGTFSVVYAAHRLLADDTDCADPDPFFSVGCRISVVVLDSAGNPDDSFGLSSQGDPGAFISFASPSLTVSPDTGLADRSVVSVSGAHLTPRTRLEVVQCDSWVLTDAGVRSCPSMGTVRTDASGTVSGRVTLSDLVYRRTDDGHKTPVYCRDDACRLFLVGTDDHGSALLEARTDALSFTGSSATLKANPTKNLASTKWTTLWGRAPGAEGHTIKVVEQACYAAPTDKPCYGQLPARWGKVKSDGTFVVKYPASRYLGDEATTDCRNIGTGARCRISIVVLDPRGRHDDGFGVRDLGQPGVEITFKA